MIERTDSVNWSSLKHMATSPKHYRWALTHPTEDTEALLLGRLVHCMVYERERVFERYITQPNYHRGMNDETAIAKGYAGGKQAAARWDADNKGRDVVPQEMWTRAQDMSTALAGDPITAPMIQGGYAEQLVTWTDSATGIECRGRIDHLNGRLSDLKTTRDLVRFASQAMRLSYHGQIAFYADGLAANGIALSEPPAWVVVENEQPHDAVVLAIGDETIAAGRRLYQTCLDRLAECRATDCWPGVSGGMMSRFVPPAWAVEAEPELTMAGVPIEL